MDGFYDLSKLGPGALRRRVMQSTSAPLLRPFGPSRPAAEHADRGVVGHGVKPRAQRSHIAATLESGVCIDQRVLDCFLSVCLAQDVSTVTEQGSPVAVHDCLEGVGRALPGELGQPLVARGANDRGPRQPRCGSQDGIQVWLRGGSVFLPRPVSSDRVRLSTHRLAGGAGQPWLLSRAEWCRRWWLLAADVALVELLPVVGA